MSALDGVGGVRGWRWLLFVQGVPSVLLGLIAPAVLTDRPEQALGLGLGLGFGFGFGFGLGFGLGFGFGFG